MSRGSVTPARAAAANAFVRIREAVDSRQSFLVEAGAGAGKTSSLIETLNLLIDRSVREQWASHRQIACITYTNVAVNEIVTRIDAHPRARCSTIHGFCWDAIKRFQPAMREALPGVGSWQKRCERNGVKIADQPISYSLGLPKITEAEVHLGHSDVTKLMTGLLELPRFRDLLADRFPFILIDEYQDSERPLTEALLRHFVAAQPAVRPVLGFFGDYWQQIYATGIGRISDASLVEIPKPANFRSSPPIVQVLSSMRPELPQEPDRTGPAFSPVVFHTNDWQVHRLADGQFDGDLAPADSRAALKSVRDLAETAEDAKVLMLTHRVLGASQGYTHLVDAFGSLEGLTTLDDPHLRFFVDTLEPVLGAFESRRYAEMFQILSGRVPQINGAGDKAKWNSAIKAVAAARAGTVGDVLREVRLHGLPPLPDRLVRRENGDMIDPKESVSRLFSNLDELMNVPYCEVARFARFISNSAPFATKHGVKGAEFDSVVVVASRGWSQYDFNQMLELRAADSELSEEEERRLQRNLNLFYVACSRARDQLTVLFTQRLTDAALRTLEDWFGAENVRSLPSP